MAHVIKLEKDNLDEYLTDENLVVGFHSDSCKTCKEIEPYYSKLDDKFTVIIVNAVRHIRSSRFMPGGIKFYPTIGLFNKGYFIKELKMLDVANNKI